MDFDIYFRALFALIFVIVLITMAALLFKKYIVHRGISVKKDSEKTLKVEEITIIDARSKLVLIRRDNVKHLLLLSQNGQTIVESNIADKC